MSWIIDIIKELRLLGVHREKIALVDFKLGETEERNTVLETENLALRRENSTLQTRLQEAQAETQQLREHVEIIEREKTALHAETYKTIEPPHTDNLDETKTMLLIIIASYGTCEVFQIVDSLNNRLKQAGKSPLITTRIENHLDSLYKEEFISMVKYAASLRPVQCSLKPRGSKYLEDNNLWPTADAR